MASNNTKKQKINVAKKFISYKPPTKLTLDDNPTLKFSSSGEHKKIKRGRNQVSEKLGA